MTTAVTTSKRPSLAGVEENVLGWLSTMPFLEQRELEALAEWSYAAIYRALRSLERRGLVEAVQVSVPGVATVRRVFLTPSGVHEAARVVKKPAESLLRNDPVSAHGIRLLAARLDAVTAVYRLAAALAEVAPIQGFRWYRKFPLDAVVSLHGNRLLGIIREGRSAPPSHLGRRLRSLLRGPHPNAVAVLAPDPLRLRDWTRLTERMHFTAFLGLEEEILAGNAAAAVWRVSSDPNPWPLHRALRLAGGGAIPSERPLIRVHPPPSDIRRAVRELAAGRGQGGRMDYLLPLVLDAGDKRVLDLLALWPWMDLAGIKDLLGVSRARALQMLDRPLRLGLALRVRHDGRVRYLLSERGLAFHARRDRLAIPTVVRRWSPAAREPEADFSWRNVAGTRSRQLARDIGHTTAVHGFLAAMTRQARETGGRLLQAEPPHRSARRYQINGRYASLNPDAFGRYQADGKVHLFFLEWERRAAHPSLLRERLAPYVRYYRDRGRPLEDYGAVPVLMVVLRDELVESHFLRIAQEELDKVDAPSLSVLASHPGVLGAVGPLGRAWTMSPGGRRNTPW